MDFIRDNWPLVLVALAILLGLAFLLLRPRQRVRLTESAPVRPHMKTSDDKLSPKVRKLKREITKKVAEQAA